MVKFINLECEGHFVNIQYKEEGPEPRCRIQESKDGNELKARYTTNDDGNKYAKNLIALGYTGV